jgi:glutamate racemase
VNGQTANPKIGVLDSGVGGLSVLREIHRLLPNYPTVYFADQVHLPYGPRDPAEIQGFVNHITRFLLEQGAAVIVVACNSASAASLNYLREAYPGVPVVGMEPAVKPAVAATKTGVIGVLTTKATAEGPLYKRVLARYASGVKVITQVAQEFVRIAEENSQNTPESREIIRHYVQPFIDAQADQIALACTHFPFLVPSISEILGPDIHLIDPSPAIARQVARVWPKHLSPVLEANTYYTSGDSGTFQQMLKILLQLDIVVANSIELTT